MKKSHVCSGPFFTDSFAAAAPFFRACSEATNVARNGSKSFTKSVLIADSRSSTYVRCRIRWYATYSESARESDTSG